MEETVLTVDTSTSAGSVALTRGESLLGEVFLNLENTHSDRVLVSLRQLLADAGMSLEMVDAFGIVLGPGAFTGLRVGVATVKGLAIATGRPVVGVSSLRTLAVQVPAPRFPLCALLDARKKEVYAGLFGWREGLPAPLGPERVLPPEALLDTLEGPVVFVGEGAATYRTLIVRRLGQDAHFVPWTFHLPRASHAAALVLSGFRQKEFLPLEQLVPCYIRPSEAEILWASRREEGLIEG
jgi:tRNA threonylcarbamoyladenosine biosynthesis protein TsaB